MANVDDLIECPYCGTSMLLGNLPIVATTLVGDVDPVLMPTKGLPDDDLEAVLDGSHHVDFRPPISGMLPLGWIGRWPVVAKAPLVAHREREAVRRLFQPKDPLPPLLPPEALGRPEDRPARICRTCQHPLPPSLDERDYFTVAVVGVNGASKTSYIASALKAGYVDQGLRTLGCMEFEPDGPSAKDYEHHFHRPIFVEKRSRRATPSVRGRVFAPLVFRTWFLNAQRRSLLLFHDVAGEDLADYRRRPIAAPYVRRADAVVFLVDPRWVPGFRDLLDDGMAAPTNEQIGVFTSIVEDLARPAVPVVVALSKSDLLRPHLGDSYRFLSPPPATGPEWLDDLKAVDEEVRGLLKEYGAPALVSKADTLHSSRFCAVSPLGSDPGEDAPIELLRPLRVLDPLANALSQIADLGIQG